jgi:hypothetical protein
MDTSTSDGRKQKEIEVLLARNAVVVGACELDLMVFLYRHPRTLLTNEQIAAFVGYDMKQIALVIETFIAAGLLERTQNSMHAARMYLLLLDGPQITGLKTLLDMASTLQGRRDILQILNSRRSNPPADAKLKPRLRAIA